MNRNRLAGLAAAALLWLSLQAYGLEAGATITNNNGKDMANLPVFVKISFVFGNGTDFTQLNPSGFHIYDRSGREVDFVVLSMPPTSSVPNDEVIFFIPRLAKYAELWTVIELLLP